MFFQFSCKISPSWQRSRKESGSWANQTQIVCFSMISNLKKHLFGQVPSQSAAYSALTRQSAVHKESRLIKGQSKQKTMKAIYQKNLFLAQPTFALCSGPCPIFQPNQIFIWGPMTWFYDFDGKILMTSSSTTLPPCWRAPQAFYHGPSPLHLPSAAGDLHNFPFEIIIDLKPRWMNKSEKIFAWEYFFNPFTSD